MDFDWLERLQLGLAVLSHLPLVPLAAGLALLLAVLEGLRFVTGRPVYRRASDFWLRVVAVTFAAGAVSQVVGWLEPGSSTKVAAEDALAFLLASTFLGLLVVGRERASSFARLLASLTAFAGTSLWAFRTMGPRFLHSVSAGWLGGAFVMVGVASWYLRKGRETDVATTSLKLGTLSAFVAAVLVFVSGDGHARHVAQTRPAQFAAMQGLYSTQAGAPLILLSLPPGPGGKPRGPELAVTSLTSFLAFGSFQAPVKGLDQLPREDWPDVAVSFLSFHNMVILGNVMALEVLVGAFLLLRKRLLTARRWQFAMMWSVPLPLIASQLGWTVVEAGRQPWSLRAGGAVSRAALAPDLLVSLVLVLVVHGLLLGLWLLLLSRVIRRGPESLDVVYGRSNRSDEELLHA